MAWFMVDDQLALHKKVCEAGNAAMGLWVRAGAWSMQNLTEGFVSMGAVRALGTAGQAKALVTSKLWVKVDGGYRFHEWGTRQLSAEQIAERRRKRAEAGSKGGKASGQSRNEAKREANASANPEQNETLVLVPVPSVVALGGEVTQVDATEPPPRCPAHLNHPDPPNCIPCRNARLANEKWQEGALERTRQARAEAKAVADNCKVCQGTHWIPDTEPAEPCDHQEQAHA